MSKTAELIRNAREQRGLSQRALAERAGVEQSTIARIELGDSDPAYSTVIRLLDAAGFQLPEPQPSIPTLAEAAIGADEIDWTMLRSVTDPAWSLTAYNSSVSPESLQIALRWWGIGLPLAVLYFYIVFRLHRGKAVAATGHDGY